MVVVIVLVEKLNIVVFLGRDVVMVVVYIVVGVLVGRFVMFVLIVLSVLFGLRKKLLVRWNLEIVLLTILRLIMISLLLGILNLLCMVLVYFCVIFRCWLS